jgi:hypothetical protein
MKSKFPREFTWFSIYCRKYSSLRKPNGLPDHEGMERGDDVSRVDGGGQLNWVGELYGNLTVLRDGEPLGASLFGYANSEFDAAISTPHGTCRQPGCIDGIDDDLACN